ncbi:low molecular weight phosphatase family protein [Nonomuraea montanisoli]|uniref:hypothetical protein n=1 Tax=Nonomuraea montanisoli TaxID=2741721 RepID=UPI001F33E589|nr:hypothetical protein [Nonomuraea montanisoli]
MSQTYRHPDLSVDLPLLAERFAPQRLHALAAGRPQPAMGFFRHLAGDRALAWSGGSEFAGEVNPAAVASMAERGIDISAEFPEPWTDVRPSRDEIERRVRRLLGDLEIPTA